MTTNPYLAPTHFIDSDNPSVAAYAQSKVKHGQTPTEQAVALYCAVRDEILYDPYHLVLKPEVISASLTLQRGRGYCIEKSLLLAACGRALGIPSRLGFSIVRNHIATQKFIDMLRTDKFVFHGYNEFLLNGQWVKCTPAFNKTLCEKFNVQPLEFDGVNDSVFHEFEGGKQFMEYLHEYGQFDDLPYELFVHELKVHYPHLFEKNREKVLGTWEVE